MPKEPQLTLPNGALLTIELQTSCLYALHYILQATVMLLICGPIDQNVAHEDLSAFQPLEGPQHLPLEDFGCARFTEWEPLEVESAKWRNEGIELIAVWK